ncbi:MAG TPA: prenyltransferase/squalene oxidase repeat-containing protein, partial [Rhizomicrobium sp.]|nr:prenyltransferase/squalene oxidase repeat-containing protein [Rhizomicrobium sp.]
MNDIGVATRDISSLDESIARAARALRSCQRDDGHFIFELEADATIPAEYVLLVHYLGEKPDLELERKIGNYLRRVQASQGGWPLYHGGAFDISATVKAYFALKMIGDPVDSPHMKRARDAILAEGGAVRCNVFTRILLALYGEVSWAAIPTIPVEIILLPRSFPVHLSKMSYWARTVLVPLLVLTALRPVARNPRGVRLRELFVSYIAPPPSRAPHQDRYWAALFHVIDTTLKRIGPFWPKALRKRAIARCVEFVTERLNGEDGLGAIYPAMANSVMMYDALGYAPDHPHRAIARISIDKLLVIRDDEAYCQPCVSPVWDTALAAHALMEAAGHAMDDRVASLCEWLKGRQVLNVKGDWSDAR